MTMAGFNEVVRRNWNQEAIRLVKGLHDDFSHLEMNDEELYVLYMAVLQTAKVPGDAAELGVYKGASARLICEAKGARHVHLFDTFEGLPGTLPIDQAEGFEPFYQGEYAANLRSVKNYLNGYSAVSFHPGLFPGTADSIRDGLFSFVHLDADIYMSTRAGLEIFWPKMSPGGILLIHDWVQSAGVREAVDGFFVDKLSPVVALPTKQCLIVKT